MTIILLFLGFLVGAFIMTMGGGGGAFYLGIMTGVAHLSPGTAAATSLFTAIPALAVGCYSHYRTGNMRFHAGNEILMTAVPATIIGSLAAPHIPEVVYSWAIAVIFVVLGVQMLRQSFARKVKKATQPAWFAYVLGAISGLMVGVAGLSGGGPIMAGLMLMGLDMPHAAATSSYALVSLSVIGCLLHATQGTIAWQVGGLLILGSLVGAAITPRILNRFDPRLLTAILRPILGIMLLIMAVAQVW
ncbi:sulfite exporter TauE/SafE family protein [Lacticaseibacillus paracasei]|uniref:sulfite exporter TauE/SafE family protein n=1 Tax=Lacticaseibacillus paracasei TaxID=1597 RepID=UPI0021A8E9AA|nr:sulfite exporter TauE/SafE family protein [Lacticaseibacillus paracasei]UWP75672.1 sulfite exporter TauE/SafE family protein [Lacticaseibacillus paracasei]